MLSPHKLLNVDSSEDVLNAKTEIPDMQPRATARRRAHHRLLLTGTDA